MAKGMTGNKGEWSEIYALFKLIADKKMYAGNDKFERIENLFYPIISILRVAKNESHQYSYGGKDVIVVFENKEYRFPINRFQEQVEKLSEILSAKSTGNIEIPEVEDFLNSINVKTLKPKSNKKSDVWIKIHDLRSGINPQLGFSIKSQFGSPSTLFNAGLNTNFIFEIEGIGFSEGEIQRINSIVDPPKIKSRIEEIECLGGKFIWRDTAKDMLRNNLILIDTALPLIMAEILFKYYSTNYSKTSDLIEQIKADNPLKFDNSCGHPFYSYKIKRFLTDIALGLMASKVWKGKFDATGGYLVVTKAGEVLCYHIYNRNDFEDYLVANTKFETASLSRHKFGVLYKENGRYFMKLNLQIRFIK